MARKPAACIAPALVRRANRVAAALKRRKLTVVTAESCTGGLIAAALSQAEGAADVLQGGFVTYTKAHKTRALGVGKAMLAREGAVSPRVAAGMAAGALKRSAADIAVAVTGVLGPAPDIDGNPVGRVCFCVARAGKPPRPIAVRFKRQSHDRLRHAAVAKALDLLAAALKG